MKFNDQTPLFLTEILSYAKERRVKKAIDATFAGGGHGITLGQQGIKVLGIEWDQEMLSLGLANIDNYKLKKQVKLISGNYAYIEKLAKQHSFSKVDLIIFDLGLSMHQLKYSNRGFSYKTNEPLDLRINRRLKTQASDLLNCCTKEDLYEVLTKHIEDVNTKNLADLIIKQRWKRKIITVGDLISVINGLNLSNQQSNNLIRKTLQGLRMIINDEILNLKKGLKGAVSILRPNGVLLIITFHSLEDRVVKLTMQKYKEMKNLGKPKQNKSYNFAKGAKLRCYEKLV